MKTLLILSLTLFSQVIFSQSNKRDTIYIYYDKFKDEHFNHKGNINYFNICLENKKQVHFQYGTAINPKIVKTFNKKITDRKILSKIIEMDNPSKNIIYIIVLKSNNNFQIYEADHIFRNITD